jgi:RNA polymerase sigma-70 factor (ECF subfamily)
LVEHVDWPARLARESPERDDAIAELRAILVRGLTRSLGQRGASGLAEDIAQEAVLKVLASLDSFEGRSRFTTWAMTIANRLGVSELRKRRHRDVSLDGVSTGDSLRIQTPDPAPNATEVLQRDAIVRTLRQLIETDLTDRQRLAIQGLLEGLPVEVIADKTGSNRNAIYKLVHDARQKLRRGFLDAGYTVDDIQALLP